MSGFFGVLLTGKGFERRGGSDLDRFGNASDVQADAKVHGLIDLELDAGERLLLETARFGADGIIADVDIGQAELAALVRAGLPRFRGGDVKDGDLRARYDRAGGVLHHSHYCARGYLGVETARPA